MTKYEWETELKKCMSRLPKAEQDRVLAYYNELFADRADDGMSEKQIINEFGNPADVAFKIMTDYGMDECAPDTERKIAPPDFFGKSSEDITPPDFWEGRGAKKKPALPTEKQERKEEKRDIREMKREDKAARKEERGQKRGCFATAVFLIELILFGGLFAGAVTVIWSVVVSIYAVGYSCAAGAVYSVLCAVMPGLTLGTRLVEFAIAAACAGLALAIIPNTVKIAKCGAKLSVGCWKLLFGWYTNKRTGKKEA